jgi:hypothetical protein
VYPIRTLVEKFRVEFEQHIAAQEPEATVRMIRAINPAAYELPIREGRALAHLGGTMQERY